MQNSVDIPSISGSKSTATTHPLGQQPAQLQTDHHPETLPPLLQRSSHAVHNPQLLAYERNLLDELIGQDALVILATGLGWQKLVAVFIRLHQHQQPGAVLILGCQPWQRTLINKELTRHHNAGPGATQGGDLVLPIEVNSEVPAAERVGHYRSNACCYVTTRILVVDMLSGRVAPGQIAGMLVVNAHKVSAVCGVQGALVNWLNQDTGWRTGQDTGCIVLAREGRLVVIDKDFKICLHAIAVQWKPRQIIRCRKNMVDNGW